MRHGMMALLLAACSVGSAAVTLPPVFASGMVLQRGKAIPVYGMASPGEPVTVAFAGQRVTGTADASGRWSVTLRPLELSARPRDLKVSGRDSEVSLHNVLVGERTAEQMKIEIGCVYPQEEDASIDVKGRCLVTGLPKTITVHSSEMLEAFEEPVERILEAIHSVLERTPPELVGDISNNGIVMTGGGSLVKGFAQLVEARTGIHTLVAEDAISCVAQGTGKSLDSLNDMQDGTVNLSRRRQMN